MRSLKCSNCKRLVENVGEQATKVLCWECTMNYCNEVEEPQISISVTKKKKDKGRRKRIKELLKQKKSIEQVAKLTDSSINYVRLIKYTK